MKNYEQPQLEVLILSTNDIVTTSGNNGWNDPVTKDDGTDYPWFNLGV